MEMALAQVCDSKHVVVSLILDVKEFVFVSGFKNIYKYKNVLENITHKNLIRNKLLQIKIKGGSG